MIRSLFRIGLASGGIALMLTAGSIATAQKSDKKKKDKAVATPTPIPSPMIGGVVMRRTNTIAQNLAATPDMTTLVELATLTGLTTTLAQPGPYTIFAPDNAAFGMLPPTTVTALKQPESKAYLTRILGYHVVAGALDLATLKAQIVAGGGKATLNTTDNLPLTVEVYPLPAGGETLILTGANGNKVYVSAADIHQANGIFHVINGVLSPDGPAPAAVPATPAVPAAPGVSAVPKPAAAPPVPAVPSAPAVPKPVPTAVPTPKP